MFGGWVEPGLLEEIQVALDKTAKKFQHRWADAHIIALERLGLSYATLEDVMSIWPRVRIPSNVHLILLVHGGDVTTLATPLPMPVKTSPSVMDRIQNRSF